MVIISYPLYLKGLLDARYIGIVKCIQFPKKGKQGISLNFQALTSSPNDPSPMTAQVGTFFHLQFISLLMVYLQFERTQ